MNNPITLIVSKTINQIWSMDFMSDTMPDSEALAKTLIRLITDNNT